MFVERYDNGINGNYLILEDEQAKDAGYKSRMLVENHINAFLRTGIVYADGKEQYVYDITSKTSLYSLYEQTEMDHRFICALISAISAGLEACDEYLLPCEHLMFDSKHIYVDQGNDRIQWCYYPGSYTALSEGMNDLAEYILEKADHTNKSATTLAYDLYKQAVNEDYTLRELLSRNEAARSESSENRGDENGGSYLVEDINDLYLPDEDDMPVMPVQGKVIMSVCLALLLIIAGTVLTAFIYGNESLTALLAMTEMRVLTAMTGAVSILLPMLIFLKWYGKVREFKKLMKEAGDGRDEIYVHLTDNEQSGDTGRIDAGGGTRKLNAAPAPAAYTESLGKTDADEDTSGLTEDTARLRDEEGIEAGGRMSPDGIVHRLVRFTGKGLNELRIDKLPFTIGKKKGICDGIIESNAVSRIHARLVFEGGAYYMTDLNSTNGTFVNGSRLSAGDRVKLSVNDEISFGRELYYFR